MNAALLPLLAKLIIEGDVFTSWGFVLPVLMNWFALLFVPPITEIFHFKYLFYLIGLWKITNNGDHTILTQQEANEYYI